MTGLTKAPKLTGHGCKNGRQRIFLFFHGTDTRRRLPIPQTHDRYGPVDGTLRAPMPHSVDLTAPGDSEKGNSSA